jgi:K+-transporting ATPase ATPase C chain
MLAQLRPAVVVFLLLTMLTGVLYPLVVTGVALVVFPDQAAGSLIVRDGKIVGSSLIGQPFDQPRYFWSRPSATTPPYNGAASSGSNLGPVNPALLDAVRSRVDTIRERHPEKSVPVPADLVTTSASGLDPHITPTAAELQIPRVARERRLPEDQVRELVRRHTEGRTWGLLGEPRVNVLTLNLALDDRR